MTFHKQAIALSTLSLAALATLTACGGGSDSSTTAPATTTQIVSIAFSAINGTDAAGKPVAVGCGDVISGVGTGGVNAKLADLRFYVSNMTLVNSAGQEVKVTLDANDFQLTQGGNTVALVDLENDADICAGDTVTHVAVTGTVPTGTYTGAKFLLGVPTALNHLDATAPGTKAPLTNNDMYWSWTGGYKHVKIELNPESTTAAGTYTAGITTTNPSTGALGTASSWFFHLGDGNCSTPAGGTPDQSTCLSVNSRQMTLASFNPSTQNIAVDLKALFAQSDLRAEKGGAVGCMSGSTDPECQAMWSVLGSSFTPNATTGLIDTSSVSVQNTASDFHTGKTVFSAIAK